MKVSEILAQAQAERLRLQAVMFQLGERISHLDQVIGVCEAILQDAAQAPAAPGGTEGSTDPPGPPAEASAAAPAPEPTLDRPAAEGATPDAPRPEVG